MGPEEKQTEDFSILGSNAPRSEPVLPPSMALKPGTLISERYKIVELLGRGAMGSVYRVEHSWNTAQRHLQPQDSSVAPVTVPAKSDGEHSVKASPDLNLHDKVESADPTDVLEVAEQGAGGSSSLRAYLEYVCETCKFPGPSNPISNGDLALLKAHPLLTNLDFRNQGHLDDGCVKYLVAERN